MLLKQIFSKHWFAFSVFLIFLFSTLLRFYDYVNRWGLALDQAHTALIARHALDTFQIPLIGPFSSAGPMQTGGQWYWFVMMGNFLDSSSVILPWIFLTLTYIVFVILIIFLGKELIGKKFGLLLGILAAISTDQIAQGVNLTNQSPLALTSLLAIWSMIKYLKLGRLRYLFFLGFLVSTGISFHFQGVAMVVFVVVTLLIARPNFVGLLITILGLFIPFIPMLIFDIKNDFVNSKNIIQYYLYDQYKVSLEVLGRRWKTYAGVFWPETWASVIGGNKYVGYLIIISSGVIFLYKFLKEKISKEWLIIFISFFLMVVLVKYVRTPIFNSYVVFLHPFIFLITAWTIRNLYKKVRVIGIVLFVIIAILTSVRDYKEIVVGKSNISAEEAKIQLEVLKKKFPNEKFSVYVYKHNVSGRNFVLALYLDSQDLISENGRAVSLVNPASYSIPKYEVMLKGKYGDNLIDLGNAYKKDLEKEDFFRVNPEDIYERTQEWYTKR